MSRHAVEELILTPKRLESGELPEPRVSPGRPVASLISLALVRGLNRIRTSDPAVRQGSVEGMHRMRASTRRLRSELRLFEDMLDTEWAIPVEDDLKWLASKIGVVRQFDVLRERFREAAGPLENSLALLFQTLGERRARAAIELQCAIDSDRYEDLQHKLESVVAYPTYEDSASEPCRDRIPQLMNSVWKRLKNHARKLDDKSADEEFHEVRKRAKRARYAAEAVADALPSSLMNDARHFASMATKVQDVLGTLQDASDAIHLLEEVAASAPNDGAFNLATGRLLEREAQIISDQRDQFFAVWERLDRKKFRAWFHD